MNSPQHAATSDLQPDASEIIAAHLAALTYDHLPHNAVTTAKASILDTLGCAFAGTGTPEYAKVLELVTHWGGRPCSTVIGAGGLKVPPDNAVLANAATVHQYDFDDTHDVAICHPSSASVIPGLAIAEEVGGMSGKEFITLVAGVNDFTSRVGLAIKGRLIDYPWFRAPVVGIFGSAAASAKAHGASALQHLETLGLTLPLVSGTLASLHHPGSSVRSMRDGLVYRNGVLAAELAMRGIHGDRGVFDGPYGFYKAFMRGEYQRNELVDDLGTRFEGARLSLKPWPSILMLHPTLTVVTDIMRTQNLAFDDIAEVMVGVGEVNLGRCHPVEVGSVPGKRMDLLHNLPFAVGALLKHKTLPLALYSNGRLADEVIVDAMPKVRWQYHARHDGKTMEPAHVRITTVQGAIHTGECVTALGHPDNPMSNAQRHAKFMDCVQAAARPLSEPSAQAIIETVERLETLPDVRALIKLLA